ncbi:hypothetical protein L2E82_23068 [Cichorium intybus]|uniref:Uncharacterized protein n=1 Tax=Cichorium intybus TaxID=13427 RepID=A0ACB9DZ33_CICIN|nr:hypothetical protein L2E82_23068 [Cichorium intybus]
MKSWNINFNHVFEDILLEGFISNCPSHRQFQPRIAQKSWNITVNHNLFEMQQCFGDIIDSTEKTNKKITSYTYSQNCPNDYDDFLNPPPVALPIQKLVAKETRMANSKKVKVSLRKLNTSSMAGLIHWTSAMLKDRELEELSKVVFGNVVISSQHTNMNHIEEEEDEKEHDEDDDVAAPERDCVSPGRDTKEVAHETSEKYEDYNVECA